MKRVKAACIFQTLVFQQKEDAGYSKEYAEKLNRIELDRYKKSLVDSRIRHKFTDETVGENGEIILHVRKQYNDGADVSEYFEL